MTTYRRCISVRLRCISVVIYCNKVSILLPWFSRKGTKIETLQDQNLQLEGTLHSHRIEHDRDLDITLSTALEKLALMASELVESRLGIAQTLGIMRFMVPRRLTVTWNFFISSSVHTALISNHPY